MHENVCVCVYVCVCMCGGRGALAFYVLFLSLPDAGAVVNVNRLYMRDHGIHN